jgi:hypothetical protein
MGQSDGISPSTKVDLEDKRFAREYLANGHNGTKAYLAINPHVKRSTAATEASTKLRNPNIVKYLYALAEKANILPEETLVALRDSMNAKRPLQDNQGQVIGEWPDHANRIKAAVEVSKLLRLYPGTMPGETTRRAAAAAQTVHVSLGDGPAQIAVSSQREHNKCARYSRKRRILDRIEAQRIADGAIEGESGSPPGGSGRGEADA